MLISFESAEDATSLRDRIAPDLQPGEVQVSLTSRGFGGSVQSDLLILATTLSPLLIRKLAELLSDIVHAKSKRKVSIDGVVLEGYGADDIVKVLERAGRAQAPRRRPPTRRSN